jgi:hypothetical protein
MIDCEHGLSLDYKLGPTIHNPFNPHISTKLLGSLSHSISLAHGNHITGKPIILENTPRKSGIAIVGIHAIILQYDRQVSREKCRKNIFDVKC